MASQMKSCRPKTPGGKALMPESLSPSPSLSSLLSLSCLSRPILIPSHISLCSPLRGFKTQRLIMGTAVVVY